MAPAVADLAGQTPLPVVAEATADGWRLTGVVPWASNLFADAVLVVPARTGVGSWGCCASVRPGSGFDRPRGYSLSTPPPRDRWTSTDLRWRAACAARRR
jgi:alkylation response protein AidB-like acyl-CoA dehydrogenase